MIFFVERLGGQLLISSKPERTEVVESRLSDLRQHWDELEACTQSKEKTLFAANKAELFDQVNYLFSITRRTK